MDSDMQSERVLSSFIIEIDGFYYLKTTKKSMSSNSFFGSF
jgi:hypothetical protein